MGKGFLVFAAIHGLRLMENQEQASTHCVVLQLKIHVTGESHYQFSLADSWSGLKAEVDATLARASGTGISISEVAGADTPSGEGSIRCLVLVMCTLVAVWSPLEVPIETVASHSRYEPNWKEQLGNMIKVRVLNLLERADTNLEPIVLCSSQDMSGEIIHI